MIIWKQYARVFCIVLASVEKSRWEIRSLIFFPQSSMAKLGVFGGASACAVVMGILLLVSIGMYVSETKKLKTYSPTFCRVDGYNIWQTECSDQTCTKDSNGNRHCTTYYYTCYGGDWEVWVLCYNNEFKVTYEVGRAKTLISSYISTSSRRDDYYQMENYMEMYQVSF